MRFTLLVLALVAVAHLLYWIVCIAGAAIINKVWTGSWK